MRTPDRPYFYPLLSPDAGGPSASKENEISEQRKRTRQFFTDILGIHIKDTRFPRTPETFEHMRNMFTHLLHHAQTTLAPTPTELQQYNLVIYEGERKTALDMIIFLQEKYVNGKSATDLILEGKGVAASYFLDEPTAYQELRNLLIGKPGVGWMDGESVDEIRMICTDLLIKSGNEGEGFRYEEAVSIRQDARNYEYDLEDVSLDLLPLPENTKRSLHVLTHTLGGIRDESVLQKTVNREAVEFVLGRLFTWTGIGEAMIGTKDWLGDKYFLTE